jgi:hypothetical protein
MKNKQYPNVTSYFDRHGKKRWRFRRSGYRTYNFRAPFGTPEFDAEYKAAVLRKWGGIEQAAEQERLRVQALNETMHRADKKAIKDLRGVELIYFIGSKHGPIKIGRTRSVIERLKKLQTGYPRRLHLLAAIPGGEDAERDFHARFETLRVHGEWFARSPELSAFVRENKLDGWRTENTSSPKL